MARISIQYTNYRNSKLATACSFLGGLLQSLCVYGAVLLLVVQLIGIITGGNAGTSIFALVFGCALLFFVGFGFKLVFEKIAILIGKKK